MRRRPKLGGLPCEGKQPSPFQRLVSSFGAEKALPGCQGAERALPPDASPARSFRTRFGAKAGAKTPGLPAL